MIQLLSVSMHWLMNDTSLSVRRTNVTTTSEPQFTLAEVGEARDLVVPALVAQVVELDDVTRGDLDRAGRRGRLGGDDRRRQGKRRSGAELKQPVLHGQSPFFRVRHSLCGDLGPYAKGEGEPV